MIDCAKKISIFKEIIVAKIELDEEIEKFNALKELGSKKEQSEQLHEIYLIRNEIRHEISEANKIEFDYVLDSMPKLKSEIIEIGVDLEAKFKNKEELLEALREQDSMSKSCLMSIKDFKVSDEAIKRKFVIIKVDAMGLFAGATVKEVCDWALRHGLEFCPPEMAPRLLFQYPEKMKGRTIIYNFGMAPIMTKKGVSGIFNIVNAGGVQFLSFTEMRPGQRRDPADVFIFCRK